MDALAYKFIQVGEFTSIVLSWCIMFAAAAMGALFTRFQFKLKRSVYFLTTGLTFMLSGLTSLFALGVLDAIRNNHLTGLVLLIYGSLIPLGVFAGICAAARSKDAFGKRDRWFLAFIPFANLILIFTKSQEQSTSSGAVLIARNVALVVVGLMMMGLGRGTVTFVEAQIERQIQSSKADRELLSKTVQYEVLSNGLEQVLKGAASEVPIPMKVDEITTLRARFKSSSLIAMPCQPPHENADVGDDGPCC